MGCWKFNTTDITELPFSSHTINLHLFGYYVHKINMRLFDFFIGNYSKKKIKKNITRNQFNLVVYGRDRPYFSKNKQTKITLQNYCLLTFFCFSFSFCSMLEADTGRKGILKIFGNFTEKYLFWSLFLIKLQALDLLWNIAVFWLLLSIFIPTKQICVFSLHQFKYFFVFSKFFQVVFVFSRSLFRGFA